uniref:uncharacterized protein LOC120343233 isoform X1 n=1 Tax=Styela clava TaxID=7725 RepID=UPI00193A4221|nr:uncharacterized protein LOC120343233 isoform X1 [Styela clava]
MKKGTPSKRSPKRNNKRSIKQDEKTQEKPPPPPPRLSSRGTYTNPPLPVISRGTYTGVPLPSASAPKTEHRRHSRSRRQSVQGRKPSVQAEKRKSQHQTERVYHENKHKKKRKIIGLLLLLSLLLSGIIGIFLYLWPMLFGDNECTSLELPAEYKAIICARIQTGQTCEFNVESCDILCPLGLETDEFACITSCNCATEGLFESDVAYDKESLQTLLSAYMTVEDHTFQLFSGSATNVLNIWNLNKVGTSVRVPYVLADNLDPAVLIGINTAIEQLINETCVEMVVRTNEPDYILFKNGFGCSSAVSRLGGEQHIILSKHCSAVGAVLHEIMHTLGFWHEHSRPDRNEHVRVLWENVDESNQHHFNTRSIETIFDFGSPYDVDSVMQGSGFSFSIDLSKPSMIDLNTSEPVKIQREGLSKEDIVEINSLYECFLSSEEEVAGANWGEWSELGQCSMTCGSGVAYQVRDCLDGENAIIPRRYCGTDYYLEEKCESEPCEQGVWGPWSQCDHTCGFGTRKRVSCCGKNTTSEVEECEEEECEDPETSFWAGWQEWGECLRTCGNGMKRRYRSCFDLFEDTVENLRCPQVGTSHLEIEICAAEPCPETLPEVGDWSEWGDWGQCTRTCGVGSFKRARECLTESGKEANYCVGEYIEIQSCNMTACPDPVLSLWEPWGPWSDCSVTCGGGRKVRTRKCQSSVPLTLETDCGESMELLDEESRMETCHNDPCDPDKTMWSEWESWGECSAECKGSQWRLRSCLAGNLGDPGCEWDAIYDTRTCNDESCDAAGRSVAVDPGFTGSRWARWYQWTPCTVSCGGGWQKRFRLCETANQVMAYDCLTKTNQTKGHITEKKKCSTQRCEEPIILWSTWQSWGHCNVTCGAGKHRRTRLCLADRDQCKGPDVDFKNCKIISCDVGNEKERPNEKGIFAQGKLARFFKGPSQPVQTKPKSTEKRMFGGKPQNSKPEFCPTGSRSYQKDFNGDGVNDMLCLSSKGKIKIAYTVGDDGIQLPEWESDAGFCNWTETIGLVYAEDFNNDKANDLMCFEKHTGFKFVPFPRRKIKMKSTRNQEARDRPNNKDKLPDITKRNKVSNENLVEENEMKLVFQHFDVDNDGFVSAEDLKALISSLGEQIDNNELKDMLRVADADGDGKVSYDDFTSVMINSTKLFSPSDTLTENSSNSCLRRHSKSERHLRNSSPSKNSKTRANADKYDSKQRKRTSRMFHLQDQVSKVMMLIAVKRIMHKDSWN